MKNLFVFIYALIIFISCNPLSREKHVFTFSNQQEEFELNPPNNTQEFKIVIKNNHRSGNDKIIIYRYYNNIKGKGDIYQLNKNGLLFRGDIYDNKLGIEYIPYDNNDNKLTLEIVFITSSIGFDKTINN